MNYLRTEAENDPPTHPKTLTPQANCATYPSPMSGPLEPGKGPQCHRSVVDASRAQDAPDLLQVTAHRFDHLRCGGFELLPGRQRRQTVAAQRRWRAHRPPPVPVGTGCAANTWASMTSAALRYWEASQSSARCR